VTVLKQMLFVLELGELRASWWCSSPPYVSSLCVQFYKMNAVEKDKTHQAD
jgi:hypothetical protein